MRTGPWREAEGCLPTSASRGGVRLWSFPREETSAAAGPAAGRRWVVATMTSLDPPFTLQQRNLLYVLAEDMRSVGSSPSRGSLGLGVPPWAGPQPPQSPTGPSHR